MRNSISKNLAKTIAFLIGLSLVGAVPAKPPEGKGGGGKKGGKTALIISFPGCPSVTCSPTIRPDDERDYRDGEDGVQAFLNAAGEEIVFNTGKIGSPRDIHWDYGTGGVDLATGGNIENTENIDATSHRSLLDIGRNAGVSIKDLTTDDGPVAIDMWGSLTVNFSGKKKDNTDVLSRFESARVATFGGQRCVEEDSSGVPMTGTDVTIECTGLDVVSGSCDQWDITGRVPNTADPGDPAIACVFSVFPGST